MAEVTEDDLGADRWTTTEDVRDEFQIEVGNREPDFVKRIEQATRRVRAWYKDAAGEEPPDDPPALLRDATALMAASLAHQAFSQNISGDNDGDQRHVFLEDSAHDTFDDWVIDADLDAESGTSGVASDSITGQSGVIGGESNSPIERGDD
jgi:hypothetical protein